MEKFPEVLTDKNINQRNIGFRNALFSLNRNLIDENNINHLTRIYSNTKHIELRNRILKLLYDFDLAFKKRKIKNKI